MNEIKKKTKVVATLGPATESVEMLSKLVRNGLNMARFNFSHGEHEWHERVMRNVREVSQTLNVPVAILADLQGPRVRTIMESPVEISIGEKIRVFDVATKDEDIDKSEKFIVLDCPNIIDTLSEGIEILIEDATIKVIVIEVKDNYAVVEVIDGKMIKSRKGVNIPDVHIPLPTMTPKDYRDLDFALTQNVDYIAVSFVRNAQDLREVREYMQEKVGSETDIPKIISKIESKEALRNLDEIIEETDVIMVARGDLGTETYPNQIALLAKQLVEKSVKHYRPVIMATQMLASMETNARPTRAEVTDITTAVIDGVDALMLSGETTIGAFPVDAVRTEATVALEIEHSGYCKEVQLIPKEEIANDEERLAQSTYLFAKEMGAKAVAIYSESGKIARLFSRFRPDFFILTITDNFKTYNQIALSRGVRSYFTEKLSSHAEYMQKLMADAKENGFLESGDLVVVVDNSEESVVLRTLKIS